MRIFCCSVVQSCLTLCNPMNCSMPLTDSVDGISECQSLSSHPLVIPFSSCFQSFPTSGSFPVSRLFSSGGQSIGASASSSVLPMSIQSWFPLRLTGLISLLSKGLRSLLQHHSLKALILWHSAFLMVQLSHAYMTIGKTTALTIWTLVSKMVSWLFNTLSRFLIALPPRSNHLVISWLQLYIRV